MRELDPMRTAVVGVHWQHEVVSPDGVFGPFFAEQVSRHRVASYAAQVAAAVRASGGLVVYTRVAYRPGYPDLIPNTPSFAMVRERQAYLEGAPKARIVDELAPEAGDVVITLVRLTGFFGSELNTVLGAGAWTPSCSPVSPPTSPSPAPCSRRSTTATGRWWSPTRAPPRPTRRIGRAWRHWGTRRGGHHRRGRRPPVEVSRRAGRPVARRPPRPGRSGGRPASPDNGPDSP